MRLFFGPASPFSRIARVVMAEAGLAEQVEAVPVAGGPLDPGTFPVEQNPLGKIPTLERPDAASLYDSRVICRFLNDLAGAGLYPAPPRLWEALTLEATGHGIAEAAVLMVYEARFRPEAMRSPDWVEAQWSKIARALDALEGRWMSHLSAPLDAGQIAVGCALGYLDFRLPERGWRSGRPTLAAWEARFAERPAMQATRPTG